jgi:hypothetical protein
LRLAASPYLITTEEGPTKVQFRKSTNDRAKPWRLFGPNFKWEGATRGARLAGAVLFDPAPGGALVRACAGNTKSICTRGACCRLSKTFIAQRATFRLLTLGNRGQAKRRVHARAPLPPRPAPLPPPSPPSLPFLPLSPPPQTQHFSHCTPLRQLLFTSVLCISGFVREPRCSNSVTWKP